MTRGLDPDTLLKPSGIDWAPSIPSSWQAIPLKFVLRESQELVGARTDYVPLSVSEFHGVVPSTEDISFKRGNEVSQYRVVHKNELAVNTMWLNHTGLGVSAYEGYVSPAYRSYQLITDSSPRYIHYLMRSHTYVNAYSGAIRGLRPNSLQMPSSEWGRWPILRPPLAEQRRIAAYLDGVTAAIDETVRVARHAIELARERRQTLISEVVTGRRRV